ncbi:DUF4489 domain-containing protein [Clostridium estertheticum]|uniref:DUF4489 domain-containing protein n=1 Tax=Clostridium estertheticum TaxID=238834 RepID=UPI001C7D6649|nr:DUF4489 domain-containing protein [Clostridium estertheticum]MBX4266233.1 DUF4489 domain-containing protein [Clostridium estertheticum]WLC89934.1 DUF4489 domain-containing protein [Clostridium estertheticum]
MNSMSKGNWQEEKECGCKREKEECRKKEKKEEGTKVLLKCGTPSSRALPIIAVGALGTPGASFTVTTLALDTSEFHDPCIKFEFAANVVNTLGIVLDLSFQIFRQCKNQFTPTPVGPAYSVAIPVVGVAYTLPVSFFACDCDLCPDDCCTYTVVATTGVAITVGGFINNAALSALVVENENKSKCNC